MYSWLPKLIGSLLSILQATSLRNRVYAMEDRLDILEVAIQDIERINSNAKDPNTLISSICVNVRLHESTIRDYIPK